LNVVLHSIILIVQNYLSDLYSAKIFQQNRSFRTREEHLTTFMF